MIVTFVQHLTHLLTERFITFIFIYIRLKYLNVSYIFFLTIICVKLHAPSDFLSCFVSQWRFLLWYSPWALCTELGQYANNSHHPWILCCSCWTGHSLTARQTLFYCNFRGKATYHNRNPPCILFPCQIHTCKACDTAAYLLNCVESVTLLSLTVFGGLAGRAAGLLGQCCTLRNTFFIWDIALCHSVWILTTNFCLFSIIVCPYVLHTVLGSIIFKSNLLSYLNSCLETKSFLLCAFIIKWMRVESTFFIIR